MSSIPARLFFVFRYCIMRKNTVYYVIAVSGKKKGANAIWKMPPNVCPHGWTD